MRSGLTRGSESADGVKASANVALGSVAFRFGCQSTVDDHIF